MQNVYFDLLKQWCDELIEHQVKNMGPEFDGAFLCPACKVEHGRCQDAVYPFMYMADRTGDMKYVEAAKAVFDWHERNMYCDDGSVMESRTANPGLKRKLNCYDYQGEVLTGDEMPKYVGDGALKVVTFIPDRDKVARVRSAMEKIDGLEINSSWWDNLEMLEAGVHKGAALRALAERLNLPMEQVMAIGDNENDLSMFEVAGLSVAMGNGTDRAKESADWVTLTNEEDGVAHAIEKAVFGKEE